jgi:hypothetical protein
MATRCVQSYDYHRVQVGSLLITGLETRFARHVRPSELAGVLRRWSV